MPFKGVTFSGQNVTPKNDGGLYQAHYGDGILWGCSMAISGDDLVIQSGEFIMGGRVVQVDGATNVDLSGRINNTGYIQVIMNADMSQAEGSQWYTTFVESATTTFPALTTDDINGTGTLYQLELAVIQINGGNLTSITRQILPSILLSRELRLIGSENGYGSGYMPYIVMRVDDEIVGQIQTVSNSKDVRIQGFNNGNVYAGFSVQPLYGAIIFGDGVTHDIRIRPHGVYDSTHQTLFRPNDIIAGGQIYGGHPLSIAENSSSRTLSNGGSMSLGTLSKPVDASYGMQFGAVTITPNASSWLQISVNGASQTLYVVNGVACNLSVVGINAGNAGFSIKSLTTFGGVISYSKLTAVWF